LGAKYIVCGSLWPTASGMIVQLELTDALRTIVVCSQSYQCTLTDLCEPLSDVYLACIHDILRGILEREIQLVATQGLPTIQSHSMLFTAVHLMHRVGVSDLTQARQMLEILTDRHRRHAKPHAWLANWHALRVTQSMTNAPSHDIQLAFDHAKKAMDCDPRSVLAHCVHAALNINLHHDFQTAQASLDVALQCNPNDPLAWAYVGILKGFVGEGDAAVDAANKSLALTPIDPMLHYYESLAASSFLSAGHTSRAIDLATKSLRANKTHPSTYRILAIAQILAGEHMKARETVIQLKRLAPAYSLAEFQRISPLSQGVNAKKFVKALSEAGLF
jgi:adenylate cyclase